MNRILSLTAALILAPLLSTAQAGTTSIATLPFLNAITVRPNLMLLYDNSGSMRFKFTPDYVDDATSCRPGNMDPASCIMGQPPVASPEFNKQYYDPAVRYSPPIKADGTSYPSISNWTKVRTDGFRVNESNLRGEAEEYTNLVSNFPDLAWCPSNSTRNCRINTNGYRYPDETYNTPYYVNAPGPYYYSIQVTEYCSNKELTNCRKITADGSAPNGYTFPAKVRWCNNSERTSCRGKYGNGYVYARFGHPDFAATVFVRTDIVPATTSYPRAAGRTDCAGATCTYTEEMTNFANWYAYYKTRNQMMKTAVGQAFGPIGADYNVGIVSLSAAAAGGAMNTPKQFTDTNRVDWYTQLYDMDGGGGTPLRPALHSVGKMYANQTPYVIADSNARVVRLPCQQNFTFMTTDGYWNGAAAEDVLSNDEVENAARFCKIAGGCVDTRRQAPNSRYDNGASLADVALYWYNGGSNTGTGSLNSGIEVGTGIVPGAPGENKKLHMKTYALGLGVDGIMAYDEDYENAQPGTDFYKLINQVPTGCPWNNNGPYVWPDPKTDTPNASTIQARVDDLWHAAVNGHGKYFSATDPLQVVGGVRDALAHIAAKTGAAASIGTSTPQLSGDDSAVFATTFKTFDWYGTLRAKKLDPITAELLSNVDWSTNATLGTKVGESSDTRTIYMLDTATRALKAFRFSEMSTAEQAWFSNKCRELAQCLTMTATNKAIVNDGANLVNWLRGQQGNANGVLFRAYARTGDLPDDPPTSLPIVLGDVASSRPAYLREPRKNYPAADYQTFKSTHANRSATVFVGANDGMLHAFDAANGTERWAYAPRITMKKLFRQADITYRTNHQYTVDGSPELADVKIDGAWRTVLVGGLNAGGRGYYALDVTDPTAPQALWELCADSTVCTDNNDADIGLTFGNPQFGTWRDATGAEKWVVFLTSGYNNVPGTDGVNSGTGEGFLYVVDVATGRVLAKTGTGPANGTVATPSGLARITAITSNPSTDPLVTFVYGGDNQGRMWRFDFTARGAPQVLMMGNAGANQPITARPDVTLCPAVNAAGQSELVRVVAFGTGRLLDQSDVTDTNVQSAYVLADKGVALGSIPVASLAQQTLTAVGTGAQTTYTIDGANVNLSTGNGWYVNFNRNTRERANLDTKIVRGTFAIFTNVPSAEPDCSVGGKSFVYHLNVCTGKAVRSDGVAGKPEGDVIIIGDPPIVETAGGDIVRKPGGNDGSVLTEKDPPAVSSGAARAGWRRVRE